MKEETRITQIGRQRSTDPHFVNTAIHRGSTVLFPTYEQFQKSESLGRHQLSYGAEGTPTSFAVEQAIADLEGAAAGFIVPTGLAAVTTGLMAVLKAGDHLLIADSIYGPTRRFAVSTLIRFGIDVEFFPPCLGAEIARLFRPNTRAVMAESPGSLTFEIQDIPAIAEVAHKHGAVVLLDNTWATPLYFKPFDHGVDISIQAATKYLSGHSDLLAGTIATTAALSDQVYHQLHDLGMTSAPEDCFLLLRGLRTLSVRLERHQQTALILAEWLAGRAEVARVLHPARPDFPTHDLWKRDFTGATGLFGCILKPVTKKQLAAFLDEMRYFGMGFSWGGFESLLIPCNPRSSRSSTTWEEPGQLLRISAGLEHPDDLIADLTDGFARMAKAA